MSARAGTLGAMPVNPSAPAAIVAGDSVAWRESAPDHPASAGWALRATLTGPSAPLTVNATPDGDGWRVSLTAAQTAALTPGVWRLAVYLVNADQRATLRVGQLMVAPNPVLSIGTVDPRSHARKTLAAIEAWIERRASWAASVSVDGQLIQHYPVDQLLMLRDRYRADVAREDAAERVRVGGRRPTALHVRFTR